MAETDTTKDQAQEHQGFFRRRRLRKEARHLMRHAAHVRNMREDVAPADELEALRAAQHNVYTSVKQKDYRLLPDYCETLSSRIHALVPQRSAPSFRENLEVVVVAIAVALAFRAYFVQPFKIPTGSMQPTLYGIHSKSYDAPPTILDRMPLKVLKFVVTGEWYTVRKAKASGRLSQPALSRKDQSVLLYRIGNAVHKVPKDRRARMQPGTFVYKGDVLWSGIVTRGDHVFVDKVSWNIRRPKRGEIMVFKTDGIEGLQPGTHYIKRMTGLPGETVGIDPPRLLINETPVTKPHTIARVQAMHNGYEGYQLIGSQPAESRQPLRTRRDRFQLGPTEYFAMGDNTTNSRDSRYWGAVPREKLVGPAFLVYWPISGRFGPSKWHR